MTTATTPKLALPFLQPGQALKTITHNEALKRLDVGIYLSCSDMAAEILPETPYDGQVIIMSNSAGGPIAEHAGDIGAMSNGIWDWFTPSSGMSVWDEAEQTLRIFNGADWVGSTNFQALESLPQLGLNTSAAPSQRLAIASDTSLFSHDGSSHRMGLNRAAETDVASLIFQTDYVGEAEIGLAGAQGFSIKTSLDGDTWSDRLTTPNDYAGLRAPAFGSARLYIPNDAAILFPTPASGGIFAVTIVSDSAYPTVNRSGLLAYDTGETPTLVNLAKTNRVEIHSQIILDGTTSAPDNLGISAMNGGIYIENRLNNERIISLTFLC